ncbi:ACP S-malonyltransferase [Clostridium sp. BNL1100]|uniref:ACP S-malonyltransferase n=1 Tax=Clostridium sp. BNL1100 TaxID=755731 RepID=UPI00024A74AB|nr:ACP S-malonyltransferase [Clostridium sp. BNL1100]AEY65143.1 malonyl CoA-acyl carrier protein transacylase [Clostridium sp. BNL1100]
MDNVLPKIALVFPGVGSQHTMMVKSFYENSEAVRSTFEEASEILKINLKEICFSTDLKDELNKIEISQVALLVASLAVYRTFESEFGFLPDYCLGHSLGEYSALCASGIINFSDAVEIVKQRGRIIKEAISSCDGTMMWVINLDSNIVEETCMEISGDNDRVYISAYDTPTQCSISGNNGSMMKVAQELEKKGAIVFPLKMSGPFHSPLMHKAAEEMKSVLRQFKFNPPKIPVISNYSALPYTDENSVVENLTRQLESPIRWTQSVSYLVDAGVRVAIEIGPKDVLKFLIKKNTSLIEAFSFNEFTQIDQIRDSVVIGREQALALIARCLKIAISTKNCNNDTNTYQKDVVTPYKEIEALYLELREKKLYPEKEQVFKAVQMVVSVLDAKKTPIDLRRKKLDQIFQNKILSI